MAIEGLDATLLLENASFLSLAGMPGTSEADTGPTLDMALKQLERADDLARPDLAALHARAALRAEMAAPDFWIRPGVTHARSDLDFPPLRIAEITQTPQATAPEYGPPVVVVGHRYAYNPAIGGYDMGNMPWQYSSEQPVPPPEEPAPSPDDLNCMDTSQMTPEELRDYKISEEAAKIAREILAMADHDMREYSSLIYMDSEGVIRHTPIEPGGPTSSTPNMTGIQNWGQVLGVVHSHTAATFAASDTDFKLFPTPDSANQGHGDWWAYDQMAEMIRDSLMANHGLALDAALAHLMQFRQYIVGPSGPLGTNLYQLHGYDAFDRDLQTLGQKISMNLGLCNG